jgi:3-methyladenine DNA glycosylase AlkD
MADPVIAEHSQRFFKTAPGQYGHGDIFLGIRVPALRTLVKDCAALPRRDVLTLLRSAFHEERLFALLILVKQFTAADAPRQEAIYTLYLDNTRYINNWDLVDLSAPNIVGAYLADKDKQPLYTLAASDSLWERRIAILATFAFIRQKQFADALAIARLLRDDNEDLLHKAVGWMLREIGKRDLAAEKKFLDKHAPKMPRTMLRYAIEKFPDPDRLAYLAARRHSESSCCKAERRGMK